MKSKYFSRIVNIGDLPLGADYPIRVQSMLNTDTNNIEASIAQSVALANAGCEMIRLTAPGMREADNLALIKKGLLKKGIRVPLIADIHFNPNVAEVAARIVEKVRINPGNYCNKNTYASTNDHNHELEQIAERLSPLLRICKYYGTALRIGTNHGSLGSRILDRYGNTEEGMVESALEFGRICKSEGFHNVVFSMKSSNVKVMVQSTLLLVEKMCIENMDFPIHLGVTEAGDGDDGIIKSAAGIGAVLEEGIGDTIRVSLTGDPVLEIPVALAIADRYNHKRRFPDQGFTPNPLPFALPRRESIAVTGIGGNNPVAVLAQIAGKLSLVNEKKAALNYFLDPDLEKVIIAKGDAAEMRNKLDSSELKGTKPIIIKNTYKTDDLLRFQVDSAVDFGCLLIHGLGDAIWLEAPALNQEIVTQTSFAILQATRARITRTEFISCPSCGRTLFDIEKTLAQIKAATAHLVGLKIAVMGCIVNGPGEMADADYGYVGAGKGLVTLYKGKNIIQKNISENEAIPQLLRLINEG